MIDKTDEKTTVLVIGASRGIGLEFVRQYRAAGARVIATARDEAGLARLQELGARALQLDVTSDDGLHKLGSQIAGEKIAVALYVAGVMSRNGATEPPTRQQFDDVMHTNVLGAMQAIVQVAPLLEAARGCFAFISSDMGQIAGVSSSHGWTYRVSKAALNMAVASAQTDYPNAVLVALSPGWVRTDMGGPSGQLSVEESVSAMRSTLAKIGPGKKGAFLRVDGLAFNSW